MNNNILHLHSK